MELDVIIPTYNRAGLLRRTLASLVAAPRPPGLDVRVIVVDNNSKDETRSAVERFGETSPLEVSYAFEARQGRSYALNRGIAEGASELVGMIDDDEEISEGWYRVVADAFADPALDYAGGPYKPRWAVQPPSWLPRRFSAVIGWIDEVEKETPYGPDFPGMLMGGNAVIRRSTLDRVGAYNVKLGRRGARLLSGEDHDMYERLVTSGARGVYLPEMAILHYIPAERLTRWYFRRWAYGDGMSHGIAGRERPEPVATVAGVPRYRIGVMVRSWPAWLRALLRRRPADRFEAELEAWHFAGYLAGRFGAAGRASDDRIVEEGAAHYGKVAC